jgi:isoquinoline 1-oxidoreductase subunit beta
MASSGTKAGISRRKLLIGGGAGVGLLVAWSLWPRVYPPNLRPAEGETLLNAFLKIATDGRVIVAVPQVEIGQGVYTSLPQILADELGADWRTVAVEPAPIGPLYANALLAAEAPEDTIPSAWRGVAQWAAGEREGREALMLTGGSTSVRAFEAPLREAGAAARALLSMAAAERWDADWETLDTQGGFVVKGPQKISFGELAVEAVRQELPEHLPVRGGLENRLAGRPLPRLDLPSKVDGSGRFAGDVRLPDMVYGSVRRGPYGGGPLVRYDRDAAEAVPGVIALFENPWWVGAVASNWWAANRAVEAMKPAFEAPANPVSNEGIEAALAGALEADEGIRVFGTGDIEAAYAAGPIYRARYSAGVAPNAPLETLTATARITGDKLEIWAPAQAPALARAAAARAAGLPEARVALYPMLVGGGYGRKLETEAIEQAVMMTAQVKRPVQLVWSRIEETMQDSFRPPAAAAMSASMADGGRVTGWQTRIAAPATVSQVTARLGSGEAAPGEAEPAMADGAVPPYAVPAVAVDLLPAYIGIRTGLWRSAAHSYTAFFTESFVDELARQAGIEPFSFRMQMLGSSPRLARCLSTATAVGGWDGGGNGSRMGIAAHSAFGSHIALLLEAGIDQLQRIRVRRAFAAVDCGRVINPTIVRQLIEGGILYGIAGATGRPITFENSLPTAEGFDGLGLPRLADSPEVTVEIIPSQEPSGGVTELGVPAVAPAIANAIFAATGKRLRSLPLVPGSGR